MLLALSDICAQINTRDSTADFFPVIKDTKMPLVFSGLFVPLFLSIGNESM